MIDQTAPQQMPVLILTAVVVEGAARWWHRSVVRRYTRVKTAYAEWRAALREARAYSAKHKYRRRQVNYTHHDPVSRRVYPVPQPVLSPAEVFRPRPIQRRDGFWERNQRAITNNAHLIMSGAEGPEERVYATSQTDLGRHPHPDGTDDRRAQPVLPRQGRRHHYRPARPDRRRGLQRSAERLRAREPAVHDLVPEELYDWAIA